jgi:serine/alanine adding enzyme
MNNFITDISVSTDIVDKDKVCLDKHEKYISSHVESTPFHTIAYAEIIRREYGLSSKIVTFYKRNIICGLVILYNCPTFPYGNKLTELIFSGSYDGILCDKDVLKEDLIKILKRDVSKLPLIEIKISKKHAEKLTDDLKSVYVNYNLNLLDDIEDIWTNKVDQKARNQVRKASKNGLQFLLQGIEGIEEFYDVYRRTMKCLGSPCLSYGFFKKIALQFPDEVKISIVKLNDRPISVLFNILTPGKIHNVWAGSLFEYRKYCPNYLNYWELIKWCKSNDVYNFNFGRSILNSTHESFKKQWGAQKTDLFYYDVSRNKHSTTINTKNNLVLIFNKLWRASPYFCTDILNDFFLKRTG